MVGKIGGNIGKQEQTNAIRIANTADQLPHSLNFGNVVDPIVIDTLRNRPKAFGQSCTASLDHFRIGDRSRVKPIPIKTVKHHGLQKPCIVGIGHVFSHHIGRLKAHQNLPKIKYHVFDHIDPLPFFFIVYYYSIIPHGTQEKILDSPTFPFFA